MRQATDEVMAEYGATNELFKKIYESQKGYMAMAREWTKISEFHYIEASEVSGDQ